MKAGNDRAVASCKQFENHAHRVVGEPGRDDVAEYAQAWLKFPRKKA